MEEIILKYGLPGAIIVGLGIYVLKIEKRHREERKEWMDSQLREAEEYRKTQERQFDRMNEMSDHNTEALNKTGGILSGLKTLLENQNRRPSGR